MKENEHAPPIYEYKFVPDSESEATESDPAAATDTLDKPVSNTEFHEINDEEGDPYQGEGGMGMAKGTKNTYMIPGMEEMSPEEYRKAIDRSIVDSMNERRKSGKPLGAQSSDNYLNNL